MSGPILTYGGILLLVTYFLYTRASQKLDGISFSLGGLIKRNIEYFDSKFLILGGLVLLGTIISFIFRKIRSQSISMWIGIFFLILISLVYIEFPEYGSNNDFIPTPNNNTNVEVNTNSYLYNSFTPNYQGPLKEIGRSTEGPATIYYRGTVTLSGEYDYSRGPNVLGGENFIFFPDEVSSKLIPEGDSFEMGNDMLEKFNLPNTTCFAKGTATIEIDEYWLLTAEIDAQSSANVTKVLTSTNFELKTDPKLPNDCEEFSS